MVSQSGPYRVILLGTVQLNIATICARNTFRANRHAKNGADIVFIWAYIVRLHSEASAPSILTEWALIFLSLDAFSLSGATSTFSVPFPSPSHSPGVLLPLPTLSNHLNTEALLMPESSSIPRSSPCTGKDASSSANFCLLRRPLGLACLG